MRSGADGRVENRRETCHHTLLGEAPSPFLWDSFGFFRFFGLLESLSTRGVGPRRSHQARAEARWSQSTVFTFLSILYVIICLFLILVVLLQTGKGGGMGALGGGMGGAGQQVFGGAGAGNILTKATSWSAFLFMLLSAVLSYMSSPGEQALEDVAASISGDAASGDEDSDAENAAAGENAEEPAADEPAAPAADEPAPAADEPAADEPAPAADEPAADEATE